MNNCKARVKVGSWGRARECNRPATKDGFCSVHHPEAVAARDAARDARYQELVKEQMRRADNFREMQRRAKAYDELVSALRDIMTAGYCEASDCASVAEDALRKVGAL